MLRGMSTKRDFRKLGTATQAELRRVAVGMVRAGKTRCDAAEAVGVNRRFVGQWVAAAAQSGEAALSGGKRGRRAGEQKALSQPAETRIKRLITQHCPDQLDLPFALWTREAVAALITRETGWHLSASTISAYLHAWHFAAQRPMRRATERRAPAVRTWLEREYPALAARARAEGAQIQWADETGISNQANYGRSFAPKGRTPIIRRPAPRFTRSMISSLTNQGKLRFMAHERALNTAIFLRFLRRLVRGMHRKVFLIVDNLRVHRARAVTNWAEANHERIELVYLPPYAPDHNPDEFLHNDLKQSLARRRVPKDRTTLKAELSRYMRSLQRRPAKVRSFFQAHTVRYAA